MLDLEVIDENSDYLVVNKAAGLISEKSPYEECTVEVQVLNHLFKSKRKPFLGVIAATKINLFPVLLLFSLGPSSKKMSSTGLFIREIFTLLFRDLINCSISELMHIRF